MIEKPLKEFLQTTAGRKYLAEHMHSPFRCPGLDYFEGQSVYHLSGYLIPSKLISGKDAREIPNIINEWSKNNPKYKIGSYIGEDNRKYRKWILDKI